MWCCKKYINHCKGSTSFSASPEEFDNRCILFTLAGLSPWLFHRGLVICVFCLEDVARFILVYLPPPLQMTNYPLQKLNRAMRHLYAR